MDPERDALIENLRRENARQLEEIFGDQKIDLAVRPRSRPLHPLHAIAREQGIRLTDRTNPDPGRAAAGEAG